MAPFVRIFLRGLAWCLAYSGIMTPEDKHWFVDDPDIIMATDALIGFCVLGIVEYWYYLAKKYGWRT